MNIQSFTILAIDDSQLYLAELKALLSEAFPEAIFLSAQSGNEGIAMCRAEKPDIVLLDIMMPGMDGYEVCHIIKSDLQLKHIPVVILTVIAVSATNRIKALQSGADAFLAKPVDKSELTVQINTIIRLKEYENRKIMQQEHLESQVRERTEELQRELLERKKIELALYNSETLLRMLIQTIPEIIWLKDTNGVYLLCNTMFECFFGASEDDIVGKTDYDYVDREVADAYRYYDRKAMEADKPSINEEWVNFANDGHRALMEIIKMPMRDSGGRLIGVLGIGRDITERSQAGEALRESEALYRNLVERLPDGVYKSTHAGVFVDVNPAMVSILGYSSKEELMAVDIKTQLYFTPADRENVVLFENHIQKGVYRLKKKDGSAVWIEDHGWYISDDRGNILFHEGIMRDVTDRKYAQDQINLLNAELEQRVKQRTLELENANKELETFSYSVSHDLRAPLRGIDGWSLALLEDCSGQLDETGRRYLERVRQESQRMGDLIDALLKLSRVNRFEMKKSVVDISAMAQSIAKRLHESHSVRQCEFVIEPGLIGDCDPQMLEIALTNLFDNAFKFTGTRAFAEIEMGMLHINAVPTYYVRDNGVGFEMEYAKKLFGAFQRMHKQSEFPGTGIGLATVQRIIARHGGRIWAESKPGEGTTFYFTLSYNSIP